MKLLGKDLQDAGGRLTIAPRKVENYASTSGADDTAALDDVLTTLFPSGISRWVRCGGAGALKVLLRNGETHLIEAMVAGEQIALECVKILATGTTATKITVYF